MSLRRHVASRTTEDAALQSSREFAPLAALSPLSTNAGLNFLGVGMGINATWKDTVSVPDTNGAAGPTQFVQFVNDSFAVFDKSTGGLLYGPSSGNTLWQTSPCSTSPHLDEIAQFDKIDQRWVMMMPSTSSLCIAVSATSDATGAWNLYSFPLPTSANCGGTCAADYPKLAVWPDAYYVSYNESKSVAGTLVFEGDAVCALDSASMVAGVAAANVPKMQCFVDQGTSYGDMLPADLDGTTAPPTGEPEYFLNFDSNDSSLDLWQFHVDWNTPSNSTFSTTPINIPVDAFTEPCGETGLEITYTTGDCIPQMGSKTTLDSYGDRLMYRVAYRNMGTHESILANHTVEVSVSGSTTTGIRWYELQNPLPGTGTPAFTVAQQGTYSPDTNYRWAGSIAMDQAGDIAVGYSVSSSAMNPTIRYTGRVPTDTLGQMESENDILQAAGITSPGALSNTFHWADYSSMAIDPGDDCTFWFTTEYIGTGNTNWSTRIASFKFASCGVAPPPPDFSLAFTPAASQTVTAGSPATFTVAVSPSGGFSGSVNLACTAPSGVEMSCAFQPTSATSTTGSTLTVTTTAPSVALASPKVRSIPLGAWMGFPVLTLVGLGSFSVRSRKRRIACVLFLVALSASVALESACGGGNSSTPPPPPPSGGTPAGTYTVNITATSGSITHTPTVTVTVQ